MDYQLQLIEWGFCEYVSAFEEEGIDDSSFALLDDETIRNIFEKAGPRLLFTKLFNDLKSSNKENTRENVSNNSGLIMVDTSQDASIDPSIASSIISTPSKSYIFEPDEEMRSLLFDKSGMEIEEIPNDKRKGEDMNLSRHKKVQRTSQSIFPQGLVTLLEKYTDGKIVILNKKKLNNDHRQKLCKVIVNELISLFGPDLRAHQFVQVCEEIERVFENELTETYYIPYSAGGEKSKKGSGPKGKLWCRYVNVRAALRLANAQKKPLEIEKRMSPEENIENMKQLDFLKVGVEPYTKILSAWEDTHKLRRKLYQNTELSKIFNDFPCLRMNSGIELIETDFNNRFPDKIDRIYSEFPKVAQAILKEAAERKIEIDSRKDESTEALLILPFLFSPITLKKNRKGITWKPTRSEVQESFFLHVTNYDELEERITTRRTKLRSYGMTMQPFAVIVNETKNFYIVIDDVKYKLESAIRTLEYGIGLLNVDIPICSYYFSL
ncbi:unnamed protein product [Phaedon cochleariae]|uniref:SAM domain-containing protein n=1 Tax=Phaedon cochleariae TaxID=80249 RepID=A0A9N9X3L0_PHACE|nr:unnamed protein product [Phaedon cochleariae]